MSDFTNGNNKNPAESNAPDNINNRGVTVPTDSMTADLASEYKSHAVSSSLGSGRPSLDNACSDGGDLLSYGDRVIEPPSPLTGCYLLIVLGDPHSEDHKNSILQYLLKGNSNLFQYARFIYSL